jgi:hypothetical protein
MNLFWTVLRCSASLLFIVWSILRCNSEPPQSWLAMFEQTHLLVSSQSAQRDKYASHAVSEAVQSSTNARRESVND